MSANPSRSSSPKVERDNRGRPGAIPQSAYPSSGVKPTSPLSPISVDKSRASFNPVVFYPPPSPSFDSSEEDLHALINPDIPFNSVADVATPRIPPSTPVMPSSPIHSTKTNRPTTPHSISSEQTQDAVLEMMSMFTTTAIPRKKHTATQMAQWRAEAEYHKGRIQEELGGKEICLIRYEPKQGWLGFWNRENVLDIIADLRDLRSPKS
ncbi:hypothetical protein AGABI1DRAFT_108553 [Agaricus bisporus var. burnettii JB137-S8]|uniref:Uncharacterized protein n=2 Tax=Agaricus bisporus var. burnettii TaxID=192524 RepID=K5XPN0_AGABU|nr:uncharacterized protein AGABI1DRAFT_108553 [Agaricus bisporus var. burnettii JB137-S8]EKM76675.1 hypothetical protein AGABI1DRAFT_108553 [Agaricus bisporus var. burnettii JB137-S8]KAF7763445.1 hypothetical protein Agabi119p4_7982 [Agaricus bisporus var. burnettii]